MGLISLFIFWGLITSAQDKVLDVTENTVIKSVLQSLETQYNVKCKVVSTDIVVKDWTFLSNIICRRLNASAGVGYGARIDLEVSGSLKIKVQGEQITHYLDKVESIQISYIEI